METDRDMQTLPEPGPLIVTKCQRDYALGKALSMEHRSKYFAMSSGMFETIAFHKG